LLLAACGAGEPAAGAPPPLTFLGESIIAPQPAIDGDPPVGGLSSIFRGEGDTYYAISDDRGNRGPARYYVLRIDLNDGILDAASVAIVEWHELTDARGESFEENTYDHEGMVVVDGTLFVSSEGDAAAGVAPYVAVFSPDGRMMEPLGLPGGYVPDSGGSSGIRNNMAFESLAVTPDGRFLFTATESALVQDGPPATPQAGGMARILRFDRAHGVFDAQFAYPLDAVHASAPDGGLEVNGLAELLALSDGHLLALERSFVAGVEPEHAIKLFEVCLGDATNIATIDSLATTDTPVVPARKRFIADLASLVARPDNVEGMTFGPTLPSGERTLVFVSDNNFAPQRQVSKILAFRVADSALHGCTQ